MHHVDTLFFSDIPFKLKRYHKIYYLVATLGQAASLQVGGELEQQRTSLVLAVSFVTVFQDFLHA